MVVDSYASEVGRKLIHLLALIYLVAYLVLHVLFSREVALLVLTGALVVLFLFEYLRLQYGFTFPFVRRLYSYRREEELRSVGSEIYFLLGVLIALSVFELTVAVAAILMTVFGDMTAALVGRAFGRIRPGFLGGEKSLEGFGASVLVNLALGLVVLRHTRLDGLWWQSMLDSVRSGEGLAAVPAGDVVWPLVLVMALAASLTEFTISRLDDNLTVPVVSGFAGQLVWMLIGS